MNRMWEEKWPIYVHTPNRNKLSIGDKVIFYKAGVDGKKFLGLAKINSRSEEHTSELQSH